MEQPENNTEEEELVHFTEGVVKGELHLKNYMEECVDSLADEIMEANNMCMCERCRMDVRAIALNNLPAKYIVTKSGEMYLKLSTLAQQNINVITEITKAVQVVKQNIRH